MHDLQNLIIRGLPSAVVPVDPVCGIELDRDLALVHEHNGKEYCFCCNGCWKIFVKNPRKWRKNA